MSSCSNGVGELTHSLGGISVPYTDDQGREYFPPVQVLDELLAREDVAVDLESDFWREVKKAQGLLARGLSKVLHC